MDVVNSVTDVGEDEDIFFQDEDTNVQDVSTIPWKVLIVDDEPEVHNVTHLALRKFEYLDRRLQFLDAYSGAEAKAVVEANPDIALMLLDVVMEHDHSGLDVIRHVREILRNDQVRIILRTGQPGIAPEESIIIDYDINDYKSKTELTKQKLFTAVVASLRSYDLVSAVFKLNESLEAKVTERTREIVQVNARLESVVDKMTHIGTALSAESNFGKLLELILSNARNITNADAGTLYLLKDQALEFVIIQNDSLDIHMGGESGDAITFAPVELAETNVSAYVAIKGDCVNIADVYHSALFDFTGPKKFDELHGYRSQSMLVVPMKNDANITVGVIQLMNAMDPDSGAVTSFSPADESLVKSLASQAAVAVCNVVLLEEKEKLFEEVLNLKNYDESILKSLSNGVVSLDVDHRITKCNEAALIFFRQPENELIGRTAADCFQNRNSWILDSINRVAAGGLPDYNADVPLIIDSKNSVQVNLTVVPLTTVKNERLGLLLILEDITMEKRLMGTLARYMTKEVAEQLMESQDDFLGGKIQEASVLFSDIRSFTTISEALGAQETVSMLNDYFTIMVDIIFENKGILDKYIGDAIMAAFGIPFPADDDADRSVIAAIDMMRALRLHNAARVRIGKDPLDIGLGINTAEILAGNIGSMKRMDYTMIGDGVNLAARLESATKFYSSSILISEFTFRKLNRSYQCRPADYIRVKGKNHPVLVYDVLDFHDETTFPNLSDSIASFEQGREYYLKRCWGDARRCFDTCSELNPGDRLPNIYRTRCDYFAANPPGDGWDGVWDMESK